MNIHTNTAKKIPSLAQADDLEGFYSQGGALKLWDDKEAWKLRATYEGTFYIDLLNKSGANRVL